MDVFHERDLIAPKRNELYGGLGCWAMYLVGFSLILSLFDFDLTSLRGNFLFEVSFSVCNFILLLCVFRNFLWRSRCPLGELITTSLWGFLGAYGLTNLVGNLLFYLLFLIPVDVVNANQVQVEIFLQEYSLPMVIDVVLLAPVIEELLIRGLIFAPLCKKSPLLGYLASMSVFSFLHIMAYLGTQPFIALAISFVQYLPAGFILCWVYQRSRSIYAPILVHALMNLVSSLAIL